MGDLHLAGADLDALVDETAETIARLARLPEPGSSSYRARPGQNIRRTPRTNAGRKDMAQACPSAGASHMTAALVNDIRC